MKKSISSGRLLAIGKENMGAETIFYKKKMFWWICGIPSLVSCFYLFIWATPRYESTAVVRVYGAGQDSSGSGSAAMEGMGGAGTASSGSYVLAQYIASWDAFQKLDPEKLQQHWSSGDLISRFGGPLSLFSSNKMRLWGYYQYRVKPSFNEESGLLTLTVDGYSSDFVTQLNKDLLDFSREKLAHSGTKADQAEYAMLLRKIHTDNESLDADLERISALQKKAGISDLKSAYQDVLSTLSATERARVDIGTRAAATAFLAERGQQIEVLKTQLSSLDREIAKQKDTVARQSSVYKAYNQAEERVDQDIKNIVLDEKNMLENEKSIIRDAYYLDVIEEPVHPTNPTRPLALMWTAIILCVSFILYLIVK